MIGNGSLFEEMSQSLLRFDMEKLPMWQFSSVNWSVSFEWLPSSLHRYDWLHAENICSILEGESLFMLDLVRFPNNRFYRILFTEKWINIFSDVIQSEWIFFSKLIFEQLMSTFQPMSFILEGGTKLTNLLDITHT